MLGKNGSAIKYICSLSSVNYSGPGASTNASNFSGFEFATLQVLASSAASAQGVVVNVLRSATSDGTFSPFGASISVQSVIKNGTYLRSFTLDSSALWHKASYDNNNTGSATISINFQLHNPRNAPITQDSGTVCFSDILVR